MILINRTVKFLKSLVAAGVITSSFCYQVEKTENNNNRIKY